MSANQYLAIDIDVKSLKVKIAHVTNKTVTSKHLMYIKRVEMHSIGPSGNLLILSGKRHYITFLLLGGTRVGCFACLIKAPFEENWSLPY